MKICICIGKLSFSGAENVVRFLLENFQKRGHDASVLLLEKMPNENDVIPGVRMESAIVEGKGIKSILKRIGSIRAALKRIRPEVFVVFNCEMAFSSVPATIGLKGIKTIVCERNAPTVVPPTEKRRKLRDWIYRFADAGVYQTSEISEYFKDITPIRFVIENPIRQKNELCLDVTMRRREFVTVARLDDRQKNQSMLIRGFVKAAEGHPGYTLTLLGDGPDLEKYRTLIQSLGAEKIVHLAGKCSKPTEYIKECRAFLLTSEFEGMPNALIEAMSVGLPSISTKCLGGGAEALIENGVNGLLIERGDEAGLTANIERLMEDDEICRRLGSAAYGIHERLDPNRILDQWECSLRSLM